MKYSRETRALRREKQITASISTDDSSNTEPIYFWRETERPYGIFCQWYLSHFIDPIVHPTHVFNCAEQYMMYRKALIIAGSPNGIFSTLPRPQAARYEHVKYPVASETGESKAKGKAKQTGSADREDTLSAEARALPNRILGEKDPAKQKYLARSVKFTDYRLKIWNAIKFDVVVDGNYCKYSQLPELKQRLLATGYRELLEASKHDSIWGIGFTAEMAGGVGRECWGSNLLGKALMTVRERLRNEGEAVQ
jgi:ribA/ribD-fused uncharacterized protein